MPDDDALIIVESNSTNLNAPTGSAIIQPSYIATSSYTVNDWWFDTSGSTAVSNTIWTTWNERYYQSASTTGSFQPYIRRPLPRQLAESPSRGERRVQENETARSRAEGLLREHLSERQKSDLAEKGYFDVCAVDFKKGTRRYYRIKRGRAGNVFELDGPHGREVRRYCCHPLELVPDADTMLAQKMMIEFNEELFLKTANITDLGTGYTQLGQGLQATG